MADNFQGEFDLIGVNPWLMGGILSLLMCFVPLGFFPSLEYIHWSWRSIIPVLYGLIWVFWISSTDYFDISINYHWYELEFLTYALPTIIFNMIFILVIIGFYKGLISRRNTLLIGVLSTLLPLFLLLATNDLFLASGEYVGPLPVLFSLALIFLHKIPGPEKVPRNQLKPSNEETPKAHDHIRDEV